MVNGEPVLWRSVLRSAEALPEDYQDRLESVFPALLQRLIDLKLLAQEARHEGYESRPEIRSRVRDYEDALLREALLRDLLDEQISDEMLAEAYDTYESEAREHMQVTARHILLESEADAREIIAELDNGADFDRLARERSLGSSASRGGALGTVDVGRMVPRFGAALASQPIGEYSREPVQTEFGWHVILVEDRQGSGAPPLAAVEPQLKRALARGAIEERLNGLREAAEIEIVQPDSEPSEPAEPRLGSGPGN
jgi:peptidyl-prolyl cis-trans isomerase C